ncbi:MAG TPA: DinB family protein [Pyrinomonadaceae bacterium]|nr:DinB family protein [Pyrinomonadaceae bacterium]
MTTLNINRPEETEYASYYGRYVSLVAGEDILSTLSDQLNATRALLGGVPEEQAGFRYEAGKWSIKELVGHIIDGERIFAYRALRFARGDQTPLPGFEQDDYIRNAAFDACTLSALAAEFESVRRSTLFLFEHLDDAAWMRKGLASDNEVSVRALAYIIAGHELHHMRILRERYLSALPR